MIISTTSDKNYIGYVKCLLKSLVVNSPNVKFHVRLIRIDDKPKLEKELRGIKPDILIQFDDVILDDRKYSKKRHGALLWNGVMDGAGVEPAICEVKHNKWLISDRQCYSSNIRFRNIYNLLKSQSDVVLYLDADSIVMRDLSELEERIKKSDVSIKLTIDPDGCLIPYPNNRCWECSCIGVNTTEVASEFIKDVMDNTEQDMYFWDSDQFEFDKSVLRFGDRLKLDVMTEEEESFGDRFGNKLKPQAFIWAGSYMNKIKPGLFIDELKKYESKILPTFNNEFLCEFSSSVS